MRGDGMLKYKESFDSFHVVSGTEEVTSATGCVLSLAPASRLLDTVVQEIHDKGAHFLSSYLLKYDGKTSCFISDTKWWKDYYGKKGEGLFSIDVDFHAHLCNRYHGGWGLSANPKSRIVQSARSEACNIINRGIYFSVDTPRGIFIVCFGGYEKNTDLKNLTQTAGQLYKALAESK